MTVVAKLSHNVVDCPALDRVTNAHVRALGRVQMCLALCSLKLAHADPRKRTCVEGCAKGRSFCVVVDQVAEVPASGDTETYASWRNRLQDDISQLGVTDGPTIGYCDANCAPSRAFEISGL